MVNSHLRIKAKCLSLLEQVRRTRKPIAHSPRQARRGGGSSRRRIGPGRMIESMKDTFDITGDIYSPANEESEWEALRD